MNCPRIEWQHEEVEGVPTKVRIVYDQDTHTKLAQMLPGELLCKLAGSTVGASGEVEVCDVRREPGYLVGIDHIRLECRAHAQRSVVKAVALQAAVALDLLVPLVHRPQPDDGIEIIEDLTSNPCHWPVVRTAWVWLNDWWQHVFKDLARVPLTKRDERAEELLLKFIAARIGRLSRRWPELEKCRLILPSPPMPDLRFN